MVARHVKAAVWGGLCVVLGPLLSPAEARAQGRGTLIINEPGVMRDLGQGSPSYVFRQYSYGLGALEPTAPGGSAGSLLKSSIYSDYTGLGSRSVNIGRGPTAGPGSPLDLRVGDLAAYSPLTGAPVGSAVKGGDPSAALARDLDDVVRLPTLMRDEGAFGASRAYLQAIEAAAVSQLRNRTDPITSLVPAQPSQYRDYMAKGDRAFRTDNYLSAYTEFQIANDIGGQDPESLIYLAHTQFALSRYSYTKAAYFLEEAVRIFPELPLVKLRPRGFYGNASKYGQHIVALEDYLARNPGDGEALLVLAYYRWFDEPQDVPAVKNALSRALACGLRRQDARLAEAARTFWDGMVASGKVAGSLSPDEEPAASSRPQGPAASQPAPHGAVPSASAAASEKAP